MAKIVDIPHEEVANQGEPQVLVLNFADAKVPVFKEARGKDYIQYGEDNQYPEYLTYLFNKSAKHNAIITGKAYYIFGEGYEKGDIVINRLGETLNDIAEKCILDTELYGGWRMEIIWNVAGKIGEIYHVDYNTIRVGKEGDFWFKENWNKTNRTDPEFMEEFDRRNPVGTQIYAFNLYRPGTRFYPLPVYIGANNYIETDIEISIYYLSAIRNGMMPSKMIQFFKGEPTEEKKREVENRMARKFSGANNAGKFLLVFNESNATKSVEVNDLSSNDLDKQFQELNKTCQQEIYAGHNVTSPILFGIKTEGQLGGATELATAYAIFQNTYSKPKAKAFDKEINFLLSFSVFPGKYELRPTDPVGLQFDVKDVINSLPKAFVFESLNIPKDQWNLPNIGSDNKPDSGAVLDITKPINAPAPQAASTAPAALTNDNIKNLTGRQHQAIMRIVRQYENEKMSRTQAAAMLKSGYGLSDDDVIAFLGEAPQALAMSKEDDIVAMFDSCGDTKNDYVVLKTKKVGFDIQNLKTDEDIYVKEAFKTYDVTRTEDEILRLLRKDPRITPKVIGEAIGETEAYVNSKLDSLVQRGYIETKTVASGIDEIIERIAIEEKELLLPPDVVANPPAQVMVKYSYEVKKGIGPAIIPTSRPFCRKLIQLNRFYSRQEIENLSQRLGYSVWDRKGGWWGNKEECRHRWQANIVVKKK